MSLIDDHRNALAKSAKAAAPRKPTPPCRVCGRAPTADTTFRSFVATRRSGTTKRQEGPFCRDCGLAAFRATTARTFVAGWWGPGAIFMATHIAIVNCWRRRQIAALPEPGVEIAGRRPSPPGKPLFRRRQAFGALVPVIFYAGLVIGAWSVTAAAIGSNPTGTKVGECVRMYPTTVVDCAGAHDGRIVKIVQDPSDCPSGSTVMMVNNIAGAYLPPDGTPLASDCVAPD